MIRRIGEDLVLAFGFLTRLPMPSVSVRDGRKLSEAFWAFPLAGLVVGAAAGGVLWLGLWFGIGKAVAAILSLATLVLLTGAMHEDGLADFWDGLGGGRTRERKLEIMRDSHIGTYGVLALILSYFALLALIAELTHLLTSWLPAHSVSPLPGFYIIVWLASAVMLSRCMIAIPALFLDFARDDGLAKLFGRPSTTSLVIAVAWPIVLVAIVLQSAAVPLIIGTAVGSTVVTVLAGRYLGGVTGDVFGASIMLSFVCGLLAAVMWLS